MLRLLLILIAFVVLLRLLGWRPASERRRRRAVEAETTGPVDLVECARCAVRLPRPQALAANGRWYCSVAHRDQP